MLLKRKNVLSHAYKKDPKTGAFIIEISLNKYSDVFNEWDPAPFKNRDIDPDLHNFMEENSLGVPLKHELHLIFYLPKEEYDPKKEEQVRVGLENNFRFMMHSILKEIRGMRKRIFLYIMISFTFLFSAYIFKGKFDMNVLVSILLEGQFIGGWVFLWEAFSLIFFTNHDLYKKLKKYERFLDTNIKFIYK